MTANKNISTDIKKQIASLLFTDPPAIILKYQDTQMQSDCGVFAIASATALVHPGDYLFDQLKMRSHLIQWLENREMTMFPGAQQAFTFQSFLHPSYARRHNS